MPEPGPGNCTASVAVAQSPGEPARLAITVKLPDTIDAHAGVTIELVLLPRAGRPDPAHQDASEGQLATLRAFDRAVERLVQSRGATAGPSTRHEAEKTVSEAFAVAADSLAAAAASKAADDERRGKRSAHLRRCWSVARRVAKATRGLDRQRVDASIAAGARELGISVEAMDAFVRRYRLRLQRRLQVLQRTRLAQLIRDGRSRAEIASALGAIRLDGTRRPYTVAYVSRLLQRAT